MIDDALLDHAILGVRMAGVSLAVWKFSYLAWLRKAPNPKTVFRLLAVSIGSASVSILSFLVGTVGGMGIVILLSIMLSIVGAGMLTSMFDPGSLFVAA